MPGVVSSLCEEAAAKEDAEKAEKLRRKRD
jgi:hypothetical protein